MSEILPKGVLPAPRNPSAGYLAAVRRADPQLRAQAARPLLVAGLRDCGAIQGHREVEPFDVSSVPESGPDEWAAYRGFIELGFGTLYLCPNDLLPGVNELNAFLNTHGLDPSA